jgi:hypothetical protein
MTTQDKIKNLMAFCKTPQLTTDVYQKFMELLFGEESRLDKDTILAVILSEKVRETMRSARKTLQEGDGNLSPVTTDEIIAHLEKSRVLDELVKTIDTEVEMFSPWWDEMSDTLTVLDNKTKDNVPVSLADILKHPELPNVNVTVEDMPSGGKTVTVVFEEDKKQSSTSKPGRPNNRIPMEDYPFISPEGI